MSRSRDPVLVLGRRRVHAEVDASQSTANSNQIKVDVHISRTFDGDAQEADFWWPST